jgi:hypothetical protein
VASGIEETPALNAVRTWAQAVRERRAHLEDALRERDAAIQAAVAQGAPQRRISEAAGLASAQVSTITRRRRR